MELHPWMKETWAEYAVASAVIWLRVLARTRMVGFRGYKGDDYLIIFAFVLYTFMAWCWQELSYGDYILPTASTSQKDLETIRLSMKYNFAVWQLYVTFIWTLKACLLFFYARLTIRLKERKVVKFAAWLTGLTYIAGILELFLHCRPISLTWISYPYPSTHCVSGHDNFIAIGLMNFLTDLVILYIPIPLIMKVKASWRRKLLMSLLLCSGFFVLLATALRNILALLAIDGSRGILKCGYVLSWAVRENFVAVLVVNAPCIKPLFSTVDWFPDPQMRATSAASQYNHGRSGSQGVLGNNSPTIAQKRTESPMRYVLPEVRVSMIQMKDEEDAVSLPEAYKSLEGRPASMRSSVHSQLAEMERELYRDDVDSISTVGNGLNTAWSREMTTRELGVSQPAASKEKT